MGLLPDYSLKDKLWLIIMRRWIPALIILIIVFISVIVTGYNLKPKYKSRTKLKFKNINFNSLLKNLDFEDINLLPTIEQTNFVSTEVEVLLSLPLLKETIFELQLQNQQGELISIEEFKKQLEVEQIGNTDIVEISYQDSDSKIAAQVVNSLVTNYIENHLATQQTELTLGKDFFSDQLSQAEANLQAVEQSIVKIKEDAQIIAPQEVGISLTKTLADVSRQIIINRSEIAKLKSKIQFLTDKLGMSSDKALLTVKVNQSLVVRNLTQQLQELELQLIQERNKPREENSRIREIQNEIRIKQELLRKQITEIAGNQKVNLVKNAELDIMKDLTLELVQLEANNIGLTEQLEYLVAMEQETSQQASLLPEFELQLRQLERKLNSSQNAYNLLLNNINKIEVIKNINISNVRVISSEIIPLRTMTFDFTYYLRSLFWGLIAAIAIISSLEIIDNSAKTVEDAENFFGYTWLGIIPARPKVVANIFASQNIKINNKNKIPQLVVKDNLLSNLHESYRILYSNIKFLCSQNQLQTIVITSSIAQEGKSTIAANLAYLMAQRGENILLVDFNLHSPVQYKIWDIYHNIGIRNLLTERLAPQSVIQRVMPNLDVISAGEIDARTNVLDSPKIQSFLDSCAKLYDFILIDSPALDSNVDAITLGKIADGVLLIVESGKINPSQAQFTHELLEKSGQNILGLVFNKFNSRFTNQIIQMQSINHSAQNQLLNSEKSESSLWEVISHDPRKLKNNKLIFNLDSEELNEISLEELEKNLTYLEQDLEKLSQLVKEQEDEYFLQGQTVRKLQKKANLADIEERSVLEEQLLQEQEVKDLLGETLLGQRRTLNQRKEILKQYQELLSSKKNPEVQH